MDYLELFIGQIPEAIFFPLFVILCKNEKTLSKKGIAFIGLSVFQYLVLAYTFPFNSWFQFIYIAMLYIDCKFLWKEKSTILDLICICCSSVFLIITSCFFCLGNLFLNINIYIISFIHKIFLFYFLKETLFITKNFKNIYRNYWNRNDKINKKIKSATFRTIHIATINLMFLIINISMLCSSFIINLLRR